MSVEAETREQAVKRVIAEVIPEGMTIFDFMRSAPSSDYFAHIQMMRFFQIASSDVDFLTRMSAEMQQKMEESGYEPDNESISKELDQRKKHFIGVMGGAVINSRLDRILGKGVVRKILNQAENNELERIRQTCLYIDIVNGATVTPHDAVDVDMSRTLCILAGELMAETLGFFPGEFERMISEVSKFEIAVGVPEAKVKR